MRKSFFLFIPLALSAALHASAEESAKPQTPIQGEISGFLTAEKSPYLVESTLIIPEGKALIIDA
ncbi:MAG: hypothetical protein UH678_05030, partial [Fibrobacteraceae bacterium]|nr:hypothetical protein [Fibrobacteraceae bacterium]